MFWEMKVLVVRSEHVLGRSTSCEAWSVRPHMNGTATNGTVSRPYLTHGNDVGRLWNKRRPAPFPDNILHTAVTL